MKGESRTELGRRGEMAELVGGALGWQWVGGRDTG